MASSRSRLGPSPCPRGANYVARYRVGVELRSGAGCPTDDAIVLSTVSFRAPYQFQVEIKKIVDSGGSLSLDELVHEEDDSTVAADVLDGEGILIDGSASRSAYACTQENQTTNPADSSAPLSADFWKVGGLGEYQTLCVTALTHQTGLYLEGALFRDSEGNQVAWDKVTPRYEEVEEDGDTVYKVGYCHTNYLRTSDPFYLRLAFNGNSNGYELELDLL